MEHDVPEVGEAGGRDRAEEIASQEPSFPQQPFEGGTVEPQEAHIEQDVYQAKMNEGGTEESPVVALLKGIGGEQERAPDVPFCRIDQQKDRYVCTGPLLAAPPHDLAYRGRRGMQPLS